MGLFKIQSNDKYGFINQSGQVIIEPKFENAYDFNDGIACVSIKKDDKLLAGFINEHGEWLIEPTFSGYSINMFESITFSEGFAAVGINKKMFFIDKKGNPITEHIYDEAYAFSEGRALVCRSNLYGYIDYSGNEIIECKYGRASMFSDNCKFSEGMALVRFGEEDAGFNDLSNLGYIDKDGDIVFSPQFRHATRFQEGFAMVKSEDYYFAFFFINSEGEVPFEKTSYEASSFSEGLIDICDPDTNYNGYLNNKGEWIIEPKFVDSLRFSEGLAGISTKNSDKKGFINMKGELVIPEKFENILPFKNGLSSIIENGIKGYINKNGNYVWRNT